MNKLFDAASQYFQALQLQSPLLSQFQYLNPAYFKMSVRFTRPRGPYQQTRLRQIALAANDLKETERLLVRLPLARSIDSLTATGQSSPNERRVSGSSCREIWFEKHSP